MRRIMMVDDNISNNDLHRDILQAWGYEVIQVYNGTDAIVYAEKKKPDVIFLDVMLPGLNGYEVCKRLKENIKTKRIRVIMLTVLSDIESRLLSIESGADYFLTKPINIKEFKAVLEQQFMKKEKFDYLEYIDDIILALINTVKFREPKIYYKTIRGLNFIAQLAREMMFLEEDIRNLKVIFSLECVNVLFKEQSKEEFYQIITPLTQFRMLYKISEKADSLTYEDEGEDIELYIIKIVREANELIENNKCSSEEALLILQDRWKNNKSVQPVIEAWKDISYDNMLYEKYRNIEI